MSYDYSHYLECKRSVDDRAINRPVLDVLRSRLASGPLRVLELGGGTGSMVRRAIDWSLLAQAHYTLIDHSAEAIDALPSALQAWADERPDTSVRAADDSLRIRTPSCQLRVELVQGEISEFLAQSSEQYDLVIANAVLDLLDLDQVLPLLWQRCASGALFWFTLNFDGESVFLPSLPLDDEVFEAYHASMDRRSGSRYTGRQLFAHLHNSGANLLQSGSSDWVVHASAGEYPAGEDDFLHHIIHTIDRELCAHENLSAGEFHTWIRSRHQHVDEARLVYIAHQLDFLGTAP